MMHILLQITLSLQLIRPPKRNYQRVKGINPENSLPSSAIEKECLRSAEETQILSGFPKTITANAGKIAVILAREAIFGAEVMARCMPLGTGKFPGLPVQELYQLKQILLLKFVQYWQNINILK